MVRALLLGCLAFLALGCTPGAAPLQAAPPPVEVQVLEAAMQPIPNRFDFLGTIEPIQQVELRARVRGYITAIGFEEGSMAEAGQVLFEIDTRPFQAEQRAATAALRRTQAQLAEARRRLAREQRLLESGVSAAEQLDAARTEVDALEAQANEQRAGRQQATLDVAYSKVRAPFAGRIGERLVDVGDLVGDGDATPLAVVVQEDPMFARFSPTERERRELLALDPHLESMVNKGQMPVSLTLSNGITLDEPGRLTFIDNALDPTTRSLVYKATVPNAAQGLKAGESVTVSVELPPTEQVVVPTVAVASVLDVDYVYVLDADDVVHHREVELGRTVGRDRVILAGLQAGERVVVRGIQRVRVGAKVTVVQEQTATAAIGDERVGPG